MSTVGLRLNRLLALLFLFPSAAASQTVDPTPSADGPRHECRKSSPGFLLGRLRSQKIAPTLVKFAVTAEGVVKDVFVEQSSGIHDADDAAVRCASRWLYHPATRDGAPVELPWEARVSWSLRY